MKPTPFHKFCERYSLTLTTAQRAWSRVVFDGVEPADLRGEEREIARVLFGELVETIPEIARAVVAVRKGARVGATRMCAMRQYQLSHVVDVDLAPGENAYCLYIGPDMRLARQALSFASGAAKVDAREGRVTIVRDSAEAFVIERHDGVLVEHTALPATVGGSAVRGRTLISAQMTEASFFRDGDYAINDVEIYKATAPRIVPGGQLLIESTPWTSGGLLSELVTANYGQPSTAIASIAPTLTMRPQLHAYVEREMLRDEANAQREFFAVEMAQGTEAFFGDCIDGCIDSELPLITEAPDGAIVECGADLGLVENSTAGCVGASWEGVFVPLEIVELKPKKDKPLKLSHVVQEIAALVRRHGLSQFYADHHLVDPAREWAQPLGIRIQAIKGGAEEKAAQYIQLRQAMREDRVRIPARHVRLIQQLRAVRARPLPGGGLKIDTPVRGGAHGDIASAFVIAHAKTQSSASGWVRALQRFEAMGGLDGAMARFGMRPEDLNREWRR